MSREDAVQALEGVVVQRDLQGPDGGVELLLGAGAYDRRGHRRLVEEPGEGDVAGLVADIVGKVLVLPDLVVVLFQRFVRAALRRRTPSRSFFRTPPRRPPCSGDHGIIPSPYCCAAGRTSSSTFLVRRL